MSIISDSECLRSMTVPSPLNSMAKKLRRDHLSDRIVEGLIRDYIKQNSGLYENLVEIMLELMRSEISFEEPNGSILEEYENKIKTLDTRFSYIDHFMDKMTEWEKNEIWRDYVLESIDNLKKLKLNIVNEIKRKESWNNGDTIIVSYFDLYINFLSSIVLGLEKSKKVSESDRMPLSFSAFIYQVVIYAYVKDELDEKIMLRRFSELRLMTLYDTERISKGRKEFVEKLKEIPPISE